MSLYLLHPHGITISVNQGHCTNTANTCIFHVGFQWPHSDLGPGGESDSSAAHFGCGQCTASEKMWVSLQLGHTRQIYLYIHIHIYIYTYVHIYIYINIYIAEPLVGLKRLASFGARGGGGGARFFPTGANLVQRWVRAIFVHRLVGARKQGKWCRKSFFLVLEINFLVLEINFLVKTWCWKSIFWGSEILMKFLDGFHEVAGEAWKSCTNNPPLSCTRTGLLPNPKKSVPNPQKSFQILPHPSKSFQIQKKSFQTTRKLFKSFQT